MSKHIVVGGGRRTSATKPWPNCYANGCCSRSKIAYCAETAMLAAGRNGSDGQPLPHGLAQCLLRTPAHRETNPEEGVLRVRLMRQSAGAGRRL